MNKTAHRESNDELSSEITKTVVNDSPPEKYLQKDRESLNIINTNKEIAEKLLTYAIKDPDIIVDDSLLNKVIPVLRKDSLLFDDQDEINLWSSYNALTQLVKPATYISLNIADAFVEEKTGINATRGGLLKFLCFWKKDTHPASESLHKCRSELRTVFLYLISTVILYIFVQSYCALLTNALTDSSKYLSNWKTQKEQVNNLQKVMLVENSQGTEAGRLKDEKAYLTLLNKQVAASVQTLVYLTSPLIGTVKFTNYESKSLQNCDNVMIYTEEHGYYERIATCLAIETQLATSIDTILSGFILPLILGVLGATAFVVRQALDKLKNNSYLPGATGKLSMRLCLGGLLGVISGIFMSSNANVTMQGFNLSLVMVSLVMGYSIEVAFSLFDGVVERLRNWADSLKK